MGHMSAMAQLCKFVAMHSLVETKEQKAARIEKERAEREAENQRRIRYEKYCDFWREQYMRISDESAIKNFEYALEEIRAWAYNCRNAFSEHEPMVVHLKYPAAHAKLALETHHEAIRSRMDYLIRCAFPHGNYAYGKTDEERRLIRCGEVCNYYRHTGNWFL